MTMENPLHQQTSNPSSNSEYNQLPIHSTLKPEDAQFENTTAPVINNPDVPPSVFDYTTAEELINPSTNPILFYINDMLMAEKMEQLQNLSTAVSVDGTSCSTSDLSWKDLHLDEHSLLHEDWPVDDLLKELPDDEFIYPNYDQYHLGHAASTPHQQQQQQQLQHHRSMLQHHRSMSVSANTGCALQVRQHTLFNPSQVSDENLDFSKVETWKIVTAAYDEDMAPNMINIGATSFPSHSCGATPSNIYAAASPLPELRSPQLVSLWNGIAGDQCGFSPISSLPLWDKPAWEVNLVESVAADASQDIRIPFAAGCQPWGLDAGQLLLYKPIQNNDNEHPNANTESKVIHPDAGCQVLDGLSDKGICNKDDSPVTQGPPLDMGHHENALNVDSGGGNGGVEAGGLHLARDAAKSNLTLQHISTPTNVETAYTIHQQDVNAMKRHASNMVQKEQGDELVRNHSTSHGRGSVVETTKEQRSGKHAMSHPGSNLSNHDPSIDVNTHSHVSIKKKTSRHHVESEVSATSNTAARAALRRRRKMLAEKQRRKHMQANGNNAMLQIGGSLCRRPDPLSMTMITTMVDVRGLLVSCAEAVATNHTDRAKEMLREIWRYASPTGSGTQRLAFYFGQGLEARMKGSGGEILHQQLLKANIGVKDSDEGEKVMRAYQTYVAVCPFLKLSYFYANEAILGMLLGNDDGSDGGIVVHIVDLNIMYGLQWPCFLKAVGTRGKGKIKKVRITGVGVMTSYDQVNGGTGSMMSYGAGPGLELMGDYIASSGGGLVSSVYNPVPGRAECVYPGSSYGRSNTEGVGLLRKYGGSGSDKLMTAGAGVGSGSYGSGSSSSSSQIWMNSSSRIMDSLYYINGAVGSSAVMMSSGGSNNYRSAAAARCKMLEMDRQLAEAGRRLEEQARAYGVDLEYRSLIAKCWEEVTGEALGVNREETLVVNCIYRLRHLRDEEIPDDPAGGWGGCSINNNPREAVLARLRGLNPKLFVEGVVNGAYNAPFFMSRFKEALFHFSSMFDALDATVRQDLEERMVIEREIMGREIMNVVACEGAERRERPDTYRRWQLRTQRVGFQPLPLDPLIKGAAQAIAHAFYHKDYGVENDEHGHWLLLGWKGRMLHGISSWRPAPPA